MLAWDKYQEYLKQDERFHQMRERYAQVERDAGTAVQDLVSELDALIKREIQTGDDLSAEKEKIRKKLVEAEKVFDRAKEERHKAYTFIADESAKDRITVLDIVLDWNNVYRPMVREQQLNPIIERMEKARAEYYNAVLDYHDLRDEYHNFYHEIKDKTRNTGYFANSIVELTDLPRINEEDLSNLQNYRKLPHGIERKSIKGDK